MEDVRMNTIIKYVDRSYPILDDEMGLPSMIIIDGTKYKLTCSIDRHHFRKIIESCLIKEHMFSVEDARQMSELYCEKKYDDYKKVVLQL